MINPCTCTTAEGRTILVMLEGMGVPHRRPSDYSIAGIAPYPFIPRFGCHKVSLADFPNMGRRYDRIGARPAVIRGMEIPKA